MATAARAEIPDAPVHVAGTDGRTARRDRNRQAVLDAVLELFSEDNLSPSPDEVASRSGVSLRSVYRYVADRDDLVRAAIERHLELIAPLAQIPDIGRGTFDERLGRFVTARMRLYEAIAPTARASRVRAADNEIIRTQLDNGRRLMRRQLERQFAPEIDALGAQRRTITAAADALMQIETIDLFRHHRRFSAKATAEALAAALRALLQPS